MADVTVVIAAESHQRVRALLDGEAGIVVGGFLARAVRAVHAGEAWVPRRLGAQILRRLIRARGLARHARRLQRPAIGSGKPAQPAAVLLLSKLRAACTPS